MRVSLIVTTVALLLTAGQFSQPSAQVPAANPPAPAPNIERGRYLVEDVAMCAECHSPRDAHGAVIPGQRFMGAPIPFLPPWPNDWATRAPRNKALPGYTDDLAIRLLTQGSIGRDGVPLKRPMPAYRMSRQDALDVIAYLRSLP